MILFLKIVNVNAICDIGLDKMLSLMGGNLYKRILMFVIFVLRVLKFP